MEEIALTDGQFRILLNMTASPRDYDDALTSLVSALHQADHRRGNKWIVKFGEQDIETAVDLFEKHQANVRTPGAQQSLHFFVRDSSTARRFFDARRAQSDVPRETKET